MGLLMDEMGKPRWGGGGLILLVLVSVLLVPPLLRNKEISHPLSAVQDFDLCAALPTPPAQVRNATPTNSSQPGAGTTCTFTSADQQVELSVALSTTRQASVSGPVRTNAAYQNWMKEVAASGAQDVREQPGEWAMAGSYRFTTNNNVLFEDHGVLLNLSSTKVDADDLLAYAREVATALRKPRD